MEWIVIIFTCIIVQLITFIFIKNKEKKTTGHGMLFVHTDENDNVAFEVGLDSSEIFEKKKIELQIKYIKK